MKKKIGLTLAICLIFLGFNFSADIVYLSELASTIYKIQRTEADITDYKFFDNIEIPKSKNPQAWPIHKKYNIQLLLFIYLLMASLLILQDLFWMEILL